MFITRLEHSQKTISEQKIHKPKKLLFVEQIQAKLYITLRHNNTTKTKS